MTIDVDGGMACCYGFLVGFRRKRSNHDSWSSLVREGVEPLDTSWTLRPPRVQVDTEADLFDDVARVVDSVPPRGAVNAGEYMRCDGSS